MAALTLVTAELTANGAVHKQTADNVTLTVNDSAGLTDDSALSA